MNKRRLLKLADLLEEDAANRKGVKFNLGVVVDGGDGELPKDGIIKMDCGTQACAMGLAALSGTFKREGLSYRVEEAGDADSKWEVVTTFEGEYCDYDIAASEIFNIDHTTAWFLFNPSSYPASKLRGAEGERFVAQRIRDLVAGKVSAS